MFSEVIYIYIIIQRKEEEDGGDGWTAVINFYSKLVKKQLNKLSVVMMVMIMIRTSGTISLTQLFKRQLNKICSVVDDMAEDKGC